MPEPCHTPTPPAADGPWKTWAPSLVGIAGMLLIYGMQTHQGGSSKLAERLQELTLQQAKLTAQVASVCEQIAKKDEKDKERDQSISELRDSQSQLRETQARILQRLGMAP
jgi:peptidoglycan hydrolase CwlO-like protein